MAHQFRRHFHTFTRLAKSGSAYSKRSNMNFSLDLPVEFLPPINRAMRQLDRDFFKRTIPISAAVVFDPKNISTIRKTLESTSELLAVWPLHNIISVPDSPGSKALLLKPELKCNERETWSKQLTEFADQEKIKVLPHDLILSYDDWGMKMILDSILPELPPEETETPTGFSIIGHVAHLNLRDQYLPFKNLIGQVLLDKNPHITTVINKLNDVGTDDEFRTFPYEVLAGPDDLDVTVHESDCEFQFNFGKVYWNSRLNTEHKRIVEKFKPGETVCDVMAGVGPFAVPAGKRKVFVWANDLNPESYKGLKWAATKNKVTQFVSADCMDGRRFIRWSANVLPLRRRTVREKLRAAKGSPPIEKTWIESAVFDHYVMNLPKTAVKFLNAFHGLYSGRRSLFSPRTAQQLPMIHVYLFTPRNGVGAMQTAEEEQDVCATVSQCLGHQISPDTPDVEILYVRLVSPNKKMYRASFRLPPEIAFAKDNWPEPGLPQSVQ